MIAQGHIAEANNRTIGPFSTVIAEYRKHAVRVTNKKRDIAGTQVRPEVVAGLLYYSGTATLLESMNG